MSDVKKSENIAAQLISQLQGITDELAIKKITLKYWQQMKKAVSEGNFARCRTALRKALLSAFPDQDTATPGYYFTNEGKGKVERFQHLALWYATTNESRWQVVGDDARNQYFGNLPELPQPEVIEDKPAVEPSSNLEFNDIPGFKFIQVIGKVDGQLYWQGTHESGLQTQKHKELEHAKKAAVSYLNGKLKNWNTAVEVKETKPEVTATVEAKAEVTTLAVVEEVKPELTLESMNIEALQLDSETRQMVEGALAYSGKSLAEFIQQACKVYAKTIVGKVSNYESDLSAVPTTELLSSTKYKTHPGRADELARRAIVALENHNNNCTEKHQKWMITQTAIQSLIGSKPATVKAILEGYKTRLDDHNSKHELSPYDNRKPGKRIEDVIDLAALVPDGIDL
ncbi:hypothetical protein [Richelia sinica]|uniref:hypothetical protein n=1 Tax=Richelia sinica TaxID=1357545 RepID=UPI001681C31E|nr:hypothetical protein [Richelia sinica]MBD2667391.1 hypothetical protein [Richelia sinica FACHB-800]